MPRVDKRQQIMAAAERLLRHRHIHQVTLDEVAQKAKVGKGTLYLYFEDKEDLFFQTALAGFDDLRAVLETKVPAEGPFTERLQDACRRIAVFFDQRRPLVRMIQIEESRVIAGRRSMRERWHEKRGELVNGLADILESGVQEGVLRADTPPVVLAHYLLGMLRTRGNDLGGLEDEHRSTDLLVDLFLHGSCASSAIHATKQKDVR